MPRQYPTLVRRIAEARFPRLKRLALAFALGDGFLDSTWNANLTGTRVHLEFLQRHGYVLSDAERQQLDRATAEAGAEAEPGE